MRNPSWSRLTVVYPHEANTPFDADYYLARHIPLVHEIFGEAVTGVSVHTALAGLGGDPAQAAVVLIDFASMEAFQQALASATRGRAERRRPQLHPRHPDDAALAEDCCDA